ncbi:MAG: hypothetical protein QOF42_109 [Gammaproteobacteria bacterium]|jgi:hypothetical protein|nr:hypothetical protein [Gammaproteobacteria bacterium]
MRPSLRPNLHARPSCPGLSMMASSPPPLAARQRRWPARTGWYPEGTGRTATNKTVAWNVCIGFFAIIGVGPYSRDARSAAAWHDLIRNNPDPADACDDGGHDGPKRPALLFGVSRGAGRFSAPCGSRCRFRRPPDRSITPLCGSAARGSPNQSLLRRRVSSVRGGTDRERSSAARPVPPFQSPLRWRGWKR